MILRQDIKMDAGARCSVKLKFSQAGRRFLASWAIAEIWQQKKKVIKL